MYSKSPSAQWFTAQIYTAERYSKVSPQQGKYKQEFSWLLLLFILMPLPFLTGCSGSSKTGAEAQSTSSRSKTEKGGIAVDVAIAKTGIIEEPLNFIGSTQPDRQVSLRAQVEGRLLSLQVDVGDPVKKGQMLARLDDSLLVTSVTQGQSELAALQSEVARAQTQVTNARSQAEQARAELKQAQVDAQRLRSLSAAGAITKQQAELAQTEAATAQQRLNSAIAQIATEQQAVAAAQGRVEAQRAAIAQAKERQSYALLASPITGVVLEKISEPGNLVQPGGEILRLGDFSRVKVVVQVSDQYLSKIRVGQSVKVRLDALPNEEFTGQVTRILPSPTASTTAVQIPVEITIPNSNGRIGSQLRAEINFESNTQPRVVVPQSALQGERNKGSRSSANSQSPNPQSSKGTVFVVTGEGNQATVKSRPVQVGSSANGQVEILSGLKPGERFVSGSTKPLKDGDSVRLSILSQSPEKQEQR
ncbi:efflux RND transporter periplasmic adaptor subunit [Allocoleopsis franciscana]|uniref:RND family efflux transporter, MFP subunit n=1 Tax=Allocoleopsis franciscana PCC 7113 TaxID=1173027 RepID=K9W6F2_9CYAN|nr:efflux RND transporter periplasmic adaptor subunit [Allocoleopsis franciscana]AFZ15955.1 RND family efflux transporter, MFP subunit [Allocoleopsis franciscana PCC 7113]